jgi:hypothetical protein
LYAPNVADDSPNQGARAFRLGGRAEYRQWPLPQQSTGLKIGVICRFTGDRAHLEAAGQRAQRGIAVSFWLLAPYVAATSVHGLLTGHQPDPSDLGIVLAALSVIVMPLIGHAKTPPRRAALLRRDRREGTQNLLCAALAGAVLISLAVNAARGWWWLDSCAGLTVASPPSGRAATPGMANAAADPGRHSDGASDGVSCDLTPGAACPRARFMARGLGGVRDLRHARTAR